MLTNIFGDIYSLDESIIALDSDEFIEREFSPGGIVYMLIKQRLNR